MADQKIINIDGERSSLDRVPGLRQLMLLIAIAGAVAVGLWSVLWMQEKPYSVLFSGLPDADAAEVVQALDAVAIPNRYRAGAGTIMVPDDQVHAARLHLASQELPVTGDVGFEMYEESNGLSDSQFIESARYQRALEVELQRTISSIKAVRTARVHLAVPRPTVFVRDREPAGASVLLSLHPGRRLERAQVDSIVNLVASSVPEMEAAQVTVVDSTGNLLSDRGSDGDEDSLSQLERLTQRIEGRYRERIESLLTPLVGRGRVRAQVAVSLSPELLEETREIFDDENQVVRSEQISEQTAGADPVRGIPGALSNQPPITPQDVLAGEPDVEAGQQQDVATTPPVQRPVQTEALRNFEIGRVIQHVQQPMGEIRRISAAVIVDEKPVEAADGEAESTPYSAQEIERMTELVRQAIGFDPARNDSVSVISAAFRESDEIEQIEPEVPSLLDRVDLPGMLRIAAITVLLLLLIFAVIKPTLRQLVMTLPPRTMALPPASPRSLPGSGGESSDPRGESVRNHANPYGEKVAAAKGIVKEDPKRVAQVVKQWVNEDAG